MVRLAAAGALFPQPNQPPDAAEVELMLARAMDLSGCGEEDRLETLLLLPAADFFCWMSPPEVFTMLNEPLGVSIAVVEGDKGRDVGLSLAGAMFVDGAQDCFDD